MMKKDKAIAVAVKKFGTHMCGVAKQLTAAAKTYASAVTKYGDEAREAFSAAYPGVSAGRWVLMEMVAAREIVSEALLLTDRVAMKVSKLDIGTQRKMLGGKTFIEVVKPDGTVKERALTDLTQWEEDTVFAESGEMRTVEEQKAFLEERTSRKGEVADWSVVGNRLVVRRAMSFGKEELEAILREMA